MDSYGSSNKKESLYKMDEKLEKRLSKMVNKYDIVLFMKGSRKYPECGFSEKMVDILNEHKIKYRTFDVLEDDEVREGLKTFSNWPTFPQLYVKGELVGGLDVVEQLVSSGQLLESLCPPDSTSPT